MAPDPVEKLNKLLDVVDGYQRERRVLAVINGVLRKFSDDRGSQLAKLVAYSGFFSMFPLLLVSVSVLGLILHGRPELRERMIESTLSSIPVLGTDLTTAEGVGGSGLMLVVSIAVAFWAGLGLFAMLGEVLNTAWNVPRFERPGWLPRHLKSAGAAVVMVVCAGVSGVGNWVLSTGLDDPWRSAIGAVFPILAGAAAFVALNWILCARRISLKSLIPGAIATALGWWALFSLGNFYFNRVVRNASDTYGTFAVVLGLLSWSYLLAMMFVYAAEISVVISERIWPRTLTGRRPTSADMRALAAIAEREQSSDQLDLAVVLTSADPPAADDPTEGGEEVDEQDGGAT